MITNLLTDLSAQQLRSAALIREKIETLEQELGQIFGTPISTGPTVVAGVRKMSAAARAKIAAAQRARWANSKAKSNPATKVKVAASGKVKRKVSDARRALLSAIAKKRWAKAKAAGKTAL